MPEPRGLSLEAEPVVRKGGELPLFIADLSPRVIRTGDAPGPMCVARPPYFSAASAEDGHSINGGRNEMYMSRFARLVRTGSG